ncbi:MAG: hypothetical protein ACD_60C00015G0005 [uncultured bacterium]|nr:MAG: hypothetical protein ACD_60C00015G0005 [uncultured bacterium]
MKYIAQITFISWRFYLLNVFILLTVFGLIARMVDLAVIKRPFLQDQGDARALRLISEPAFRGMITDRNGYPLAISTSVYSIWVNPKEFSFDKKQIKQLGKILNILPEIILTALKRSQDKNREFVYLKRGVSPELAKEIKSFMFPGVYLQEDYKRFYPEGEVAAHVIGFTNVDDRGQEGLELLYNDWLTGAVGKKYVLKDRRGRVVSNLQTVQQQRAGSNLTLSINHKIQYLAYRELQRGVTENAALSGSVVILDVKTGEVLAMVNQPSFNPNHILPDEKETFRNRAVTDIFEPGSTIKSFSIATALDSGRFKPDTMIDTYPGWMRVEHHLVRDEHNNGALTVTQVLQLSSNVGVSKIILSLPPDQLWNLLHRMGFGEMTGVGFPGEQAGRLVKRSSWRPFALATLSFGYGISVTPLQLAHAYATLANDGVKVPVTLLRTDEVPKGERVMSSKVARTMRELLQSVLEKGGTGAPARVPGYKVAGKTGTALIAGDQGYQKHRYISSFVGMAPASHPKVVVAVVIYDPQGKEYLGGYVSGPIFERIMEGTLRVLNIAPDDPDSLQTAKSAA